MSLILPLTILMILPMMVTFPIKKVFTRGGWTLQTVTLLLNFIWIPFVAVILSRIFFPHNTSLALGLLLLALLPTSGMTISWTGFSGGNISAAVRMTVIRYVFGSYSGTLVYQNAHGGFSRHSPGRSFSQNISDRIYPHGRRNTYKICVNHF